MLPISFETEVEVIEDPRFAEASTITTESVKILADVLLKIDLGSDWLAIDFGTSAIMAAFGNDKTVISPELRPIELMKQLLKLEGFDLEGENKEQDIAVAELEYNLNENMELLPSSMILFRGYSDVMEQDSTLFPFYNEKEYTECLINMVPKESDLARFSFGLPYMKSLVGAKSLLEVDEKLKGFKYLGKISKDDDNYTPLTISEDRPSVMEIIQATYQILLKHFIIPSPELHNKPLNKIVLTIPNSYSPVHIKHIKDVIKETLPHIEMDNIAFVTESDAIAYRYYDQREIFNLNRPKASKEKLLAAKKEYVLVYDIGAGTIDLTYFSVEKTDKKDKISILGRLTKNSAGNYFDYVMCKAIEDHFNIDWEEQSRQQAF